MECYRYSTGAEGVLRKKRVYRLRVPHRRPWLSDVFSMVDQYDMVLVSASARDYIPEFMDPTWREEIQGMVFYAFKPDRYGKKPMRFRKARLRWKVNYLKQLYADLLAMRNRINDTEEVVMKEVVKDDLLRVVRRVLISYPADREGKVFHTVSSTVPGVEWVTTNSKAILVNAENGYCPECQVNEQTLTEPFGENPDDEMVSIYECSKCRSEISIDYEEATVKWAVKVPIRIRVD